jgi:hypothetical protein
MRKNLMVLCELFVKNVGKNWRRIIQRRDKMIPEECKGCRFQNRCGQKGCIHFKKRVVEDNMKSLMYYFIFPFYAPVCWVQYQLNHEQKDNYGRN